MSLPAYTCAQRMIERIAGFLHGNLVLCLAILVLPLKWGIVRFWGDKEGEAAAVLAVPEDICYVILGLVMGDVISSRGSFRAHFARSPHVTMDLIVAVGLGFFFALLIHPLNQWSLGHFRGWRAVDGIGKVKEASSVPNAEDNFRTLYVRHISLFLFAYGIQLAIVYPWVHWVAKVIGESAAS